MPLCCYLPHILAVLTGFIISSSFRWKMFSCTTEDIMCSVILEVPRIDSRTLRQRVCQLWRRRSKSELLSSLHLLLTTETQKLIILLLNQIHYSVIPCSRDGQPLWWDDHHNKGRHLGEKDSVWCHCCIPITLWSDWFTLFYSHLHEVCWSSCLYRPWAVCSISCASSLFLLGRARLLSVMEVSPFQTTRTTLRISTVSSVSVHAALCKVCSSHVVQLLYDSI